MQRSMAQLLETLALETAAAAQTAERLQSVTGALAQSADHGLIEEIQALDALAQHLQALAGFLAGVSREVPADWRLDIGGPLAAIPLSDLAGRIGHAVASPSLAVAPTGDCELF